MMLFKNKSNTKHKYLYLAVIPAVLIVTLSTLVFNTTKAKNIVQSIEHHIHDAHVPLKEPSSEENIQSLANPKERQTENKSSDNPHRMANKAEMPHTERKDTIKRSVVQGSFGAKLQEVDTTDFNKLFHTVQVQPEFPGGMGEFRKWVAQNFQYPQVAIDAGVKGTIELTFVVERNGGLSDIKVLKDIGHGTGEATVELLKQSPKWAPGLQNAQPVRVQYKLPITLNIQK